MIGNNSSVTPMAPKTALTHTKSVTNNSLYTITHMFGMIFTHGPKDFKLLAHNISIFLKNIVKNKPMTNRARCSRTSRR